MNYTYKIVREVLNEDTPTKVAGCNDAARYLYKECYKPETMGRETCWALMLNARNEITGRFLIGQGTDKAVQFDHKAVCKVALETYACAVVVAHNHPSGSCAPSASDIRETQNLKRALDIFGISLLDHIIVTDEGFYSFAEERTCKAPERAPEEPVDIFTPEEIEWMNKMAAFVTLKRHGRAEHRAQ